MRLDTHESLRIRDWEELRRTADAEALRHFGRGAAWAANEESRQGGGIMQGRAERQCRRSKSLGRLFERGKKRSAGTRTQEKYRTRDLAVHCDRQQEYANIVRQSLCFAKIEKDSELD